MLTSCETNNKYAVKFINPSVKNGIYELNENGIPYECLSEYETILKVDSMPAIPASSFELIDVAQSDITKEWELHIKLNNQAKKDFFTLTQNNIGKQLAIIFNDQMIMAPSIAEAISTGYLSIEPFKKELLESLFERDLKSN